MTVRRLDGVKIKPGSDEGALKSAAAKKLGVAEKAFSIRRILRKSIDARDKTDVKVREEILLGDGITSYCKAIGELLLLLFTSFHVFVC